jgi:hypothetical protein
MSLVTSVAKVAASDGELGVAVGEGSVVGTVIGVGVADGAGAVVGVGVAGGLGVPVGTAGVAVGAAGAAVGVGEGDEEQATTSNKAISKLAGLPRIPWWETVNRMMIS